MNMKVISNIKFQISNFKFKLRVLNIIKDLCTRFIGNLKFGIGHSPRGGAGFTLVELLAVIAVLSSLAVVITGTFFASFRASDKSNSVIALRQNGNFAMSQITKMLRFSVGLNGLSNDVGSTKRFYACGTSVPTPTPYTSIQIVNYNDLDHPTTFTCTTGPGGNIASSSASGNYPLLDPAVVTGLDTCYFTCEKINNIPTVSVYFSLTERPNVSEQGSSSIPFQTSVTLRNYQYTSIK